MEPAERPAAGGFACAASVAGAEHGVQIPGPHQRPTSRGALSVFPIASSPSSMRAQPVSQVRSVPPQAGSRAQPASRVRSTGFKSRAAPAALLPGGAVGFPDRFFSFVHACAASVAGAERPAAGGFACAASVAGAERPLRVTTGLPRAAGPSIDTNWRWRRLTLHRSVVPVFLHMALVRGLGREKILYRKCPVEEIPMFGKKHAGVLWPVITLSALEFLSGCGGGGAGGSQQPPSPPSVSPAGGDYTNLFRITLSTANPRDEIRYTLDGTPPTITSTRYLNPIPIVTDGAVVGLQAITVQGGSLVSGATTAAWTLHYSYRASSTPRCAGAATVSGLCVSQYSGAIDWAQVKAGGTAFAFIRAMDGITHTDTKFATNWAAARSAGVLRAPYQFFRLDQDPVQQADAFLSVFTLETGDLPPLLDAEVAAALTPAECAGKIAQWVSRVEEVTGRIPVIYCGNSFWNTTLGGCTVFRDLPLVISDFSGPACPSTPDAWDTWTFWHYTDNGSVPGISTAASRVHFNGNTDQLQALTR